MSTGLLREAVDIQASAQQVWSHVVDWPRQGEWIPLTQVWPVSEWGGVGARVEARTAVGRIGFTDTMTITAWDPPYRCEVLHTGRVVRGDGGFVVTARGPDASRLEWWERLVLPLGALGGVAWRAAGPAYSLLVRRSLEAFKRDVEP
ncbi:MAG: SRPBCC family protein [Nocardioidaceae bacterium]